MFTRHQLEQLQQIIGPLGRRVTNSIARIVVGLVDDGKKQQLLQVTALEGEDIDDGEHFHAYGFSSVPLPGAEGVALFPNGDRGHPLIVVVADRRYRPTDGQPGEVVVYNHTGASIRITEDGDIVATPAAGRSMLLGGGAAVDAVIRGTARNTAEQTFLAALTTFVGAMLDAGVPSAARTTFAGAITSFQAAAAAALSSKVKSE